MSDAGGTDNPAFAGEDECGSGTRPENGSDGGQQVILEQDRKADGAPTENGHQRSYVSQHYIEPVKPGTETSYKTETRIELPADSTERSAPEPKLNGVHGNGNNNDASFLNNSATSVQVNEPGKKEQIEAVNLELVSMRPYTGNNIQTKGQEACEVPPDPYEEYFVPVNEHRKYIRGPVAEVETTVAGVRFDLGPGVGREGLSLRDPAAGLVDYSHWLTALRGEKLYVTKDKRARNSYWRRMAWGCGLLIVLIAVIIAILAATGVILTQEATEPLESVEENSTRQFSDLQTAGRQEYVKNPPSSPPPMTSSFPPWPTTDEISPYRTVPNALDGILQLDNFDWSEDLSDTKSRVYRRVSAEIEKHLSDMLRSTGAPLVRVYDIGKEGEVKFRMSQPLSLTSRETQERIEEVLRKNGNTIGRYHLSRLHVGALIDQCVHGNLECAENCEYDYAGGAFVCACGPEKILDLDGKTCIDDNDLSNVEIDDEAPQFSTESIYDFVQGRSRDPATMKFEPRHPNTWVSPNFNTGLADMDASTAEPATERVRSQSSHESSTEQQFESTPTAKHVHEDDDSHWNQEHSHHSMETSAEPEPSVKASPTPEPTVQSFTEYAVEREPAAEPEPSAEPEPAAEPESTSPETHLTSQSEPTAEPEPEPEPVTEPEPAAEPEPTVVPEITAELEPATNSDVAPTIEVESATEISIPTIKSTFLDETSYESSTQLSLSNDTSTTDAPEFLTDSIIKNDDSSGDSRPPITVNPNKNPIDDAVPLQVIPLMSGNKSVDVNDYVEAKIASTTVRSYSDEIGEGTTTETDFTTLSYADMKRGNENVASIESESQERTSASAEQFTQDTEPRESKETDSTTEMSLDAKADNFESEKPTTDEYRLTTEQRSSITSYVSEQSMNDGAEPTVRTTPSDRYFHTIEINGVNPGVYGGQRAHETTAIPKTTSADSRPESNHHEEHEPQTTGPAQDPSEKNVIEHMPTTVFPKVPKNFAHNVEPLLVEPVSPKSAEDEYIMLIPKSQQPVEIHAIIPQLIPESAQSTNESLRTRDATKINNEAVDGTKKFAEGASSIEPSTTARADENIVHTGDSKPTIRPDDAQEHSTSHPLHPAIFPENSVDHSAGRTDASDDRHVEDMSPFLPDVHKEKESARKAPRLDKDEQDSPNPFETHIDDVITYRPLARGNVSVVEHKANETETRDLSNDVNLHSMGDRKMNTMMEAAENRENATDAADSVRSSAKNAMKNDLDISEIVNDTESKTLRQDDNSAKLNENRDQFPRSHDIGVAEDAEDAKNSSSPRESNEALRVVPLAMEDEPVDAISQTTAPFVDHETLDEPTEITTVLEKEVKGEITSSIATEHSATSSEKPEENAVEDQYNDITDETLSKGYRHDDSDKDVPIEVAERPEERKVVSSHAGVPASTIAPDAVARSNETDGETLSDTTQGPMITMELTTQEPVLPMEIQQEISTTIASDERIEVTTAVGETKESNTEPPNVADERELMIVRIATTQSTLETRATAQVPILPEELQTTESEILTTIRPSEERETKEAAADKSTSEVSDEKKDPVTTHSIEVDVGGVSSEKNVATTTVYENNANIESDRVTGHDKERKEMTIDDSMEKTRMEVALTTERSVANHIERTSPMPNDITTTEDVRPVTEMLDDTQPMIEFDYRTLFITTTPRPALIQPDELSEEELRVIPLEKNQEIKKKSTEKKGFDKYKYKKEKDLSLEDQNEENTLTRNPDPTAPLLWTEPSRAVTASYEELSDSAVSSDLDPSVPRFTLADTKGNILPVTKFKSAMTTDGSDDENGRAKPKNYPSFIPVSEEIIESAPVTEPYVIMRNYNRSGEAETESTIASGDATVESRMASDAERDLSHRVSVVKVNETDEQPVAFVADQSFGDAIVAKVDRVTKEPYVLRTEHASSVAGVFTIPPDTVLSKCTAGQFQCTNGTSRDGAYCIALSAKCDSENDCSDGSDELNCEEEGCPGNFHCASGQCLRRHLVCNGIVDCDDESDERNCEEWKCQADEFRCPSGRCIPTLWQCDGRPDCEGHLDEYNCAESCGNDEYLCPTEKWCIPQAWRCNGVSECAAGEDEKLCDCGLDQFKCQTGGGCVPLTQVCNGIENCPDHSDEWGCLVVNITAARNLNDTSPSVESDKPNELTESASLLKIKQYDGNYRLVCSDGWSEEFSDSYCQALGFAKAEITRSSAWDKEEEILRLKANPNHRRPLVTNLEQVKFCVSGKIVRVSCQEFSCGLHYTEGPTARLAGGTPASDGQWSSVALLKELKHGAACTASILGPMHALASYSCIHRYKKNEWQLLTGRNMLRGHPVKNIVPYPQVKYNQFLYNNDIALIELEEPLAFSRNISAVCLPRQPIQPQQICVTAGWGFSTNGEIDLQQYLQFLPVPTYDSDKCNATSHYAGFIAEHNICAGFTDTDKGPCYNDEGAPLMCASESQNGSGRWEIQGLLSHHSRCSKGHPAIYSSLEPALSWLRESVPALRAQG